MSSDSRSKYKSDEDNPRLLLLPNPYNDLRFQVSSSKMSQDAEDGPEILLGAYNIVTRPPMNQEEFDILFNYNTPRYKSSPYVWHLKKLLRRYYRPFLSCDEFLNTIIGFVPILKWLPRYSFKEDLFCDIIGGLVVGLMHVPQGIAYAMLAKVDPVVGLYTSFFAPLFYMVFGTSRHNSIGSFAVVSLMAGLCVESFMSEQYGVETQSTMNPTELERSSEALTPIMIASTLAFTVGIVQLVMGLLRLEILTTYFSDQVIGGFTTGASLHVLAAQLKDLFGIAYLPSRSGPANFFMKIYDVILTTLISFLFHFHSRLGVKIVSVLPTGLPMPQVPTWTLIPKILPSAVGIAVVVLAVHISLAKMFAKKMNYKVDTGQELYALGLTSSLSAFFPVYPISCSLGRTLVNVEAGTRTQFSTIFSSVFLISIILYMGKFLRTLPMCVLSAIIIIALKGMLKKVTELKKLWPLSKIDFSIWLVSFLATISWDVTEGLGISIAYALLTTVFRTQWPRWHYLSNLNGTNDYRDAERYKNIVAYKGIGIFRFDSPLLFTNVEKFKSNVHKAYDRWQSRSMQESIITHSSNLSPEKDIESFGDVFTVSKNEESILSDKSSLGVLYQHFVIDCSGFTFVDYMGVNALKEIFQEMKAKRCIIYFASAKAPVRDLFEASGFYKYVPKYNFYPTIRDAVAIARKRRDASSLDVLGELSLRHEPLEAAIQSQPMNEC